MKPAPRCTPVAARLQTGGQAAGGGKVRPNGDTSIVCVSKHIVCQTA